MQVQHIISFFAISLATETPNAPAANWAQGHGAECSQVHHSPLSNITLRQGRHWHIPGAS